MPEPIVRKFKCFGGPWDGQEKELRGDQDGIPLALAPGKDGPRWGLYRLDEFKGRLKWIQKPGGKA